MSHRNTFRSRVHFRLGARLKLAFAILVLASLAITSLAARAQNNSAPKNSAATAASSEFGAGLAAIKRGDLESARKSFENVVRLAPASPEGYNSLGWVLLQLGQIDPAIAHFRTDRKSVV